MAYKQDINNSEDREPEKKTKILHLKVIEVKRSSEEFKGRFEQTEERIGSLKGRTIKLIKSEKWKDWPEEGPEDTVRQISLCSMEALKEEAGQAGQGRESQEKGSRAARAGEDNEGREIIRRNKTVNCPSLCEYKHLWSSVNFMHTLQWVPKIKRNLKSIEGKWLLTCEGVSVRWSADSQQLWQPEGRSLTYSECKKKNCQPRAPWPAKLPF